ncbi:hypothetical protein BBK82_05785 [Lentzea guizhouensis]|uniref:Uncharacterized protein n=1 Tax=Lentzea guizhouensis TaxID=1586287 RepID=A0A1B2HD81_9PSEU|nr:hypothetical protein BBK82_05785 [Lentzea guizhouensis]
MQQAVVDAGRALPQLSDPVEVELRVSAFAGPFAHNEELWEVVVQHLAERPSRRSAALLTALGHLLPGRGGGWAREAARGWSGRGGISGGSGSGSAGSGIGRSTRDIWR